MKQLAHFNQSLCTQHVRVNVSWYNNLQLALERLKIVCLYTNNQSIAKAFQLCYTNILSSWMYVFFSVSTFKSTFT